MKTLPSDGYESYYAEKFWELIPAIYRLEDGQAEVPGVLRALVEVMAKEAAVVRRSMDRLWEDQFIELCDDWAVPYIGDLLGTRMLSALNPRGRRVDVAKTIYYRRRKGTLRILEELISDISGWDGKLVEGFQRLARARHGLDEKPARLAGRFTGTLPGGWANLRTPAGTELSEGLFDEYLHTPDFRKPKGKNGRFGITRLNFHLYRLFSFEVQDVTPFALDGTRFLFDPSGRTIPLFGKRNRPTGQEWEQWHSAFEWELPAPIRCRLLAHAPYKLTEMHVQLLLNVNGLSPAAADELRTIRGWLFRTEETLRRTLSSFTHQAEILSAALFTPLLKYAIITDCGKNALWPGSLSVKEGTPPATVEKEVMTAADLQNWAVAATTKEVAVDAERGRFLFLAGAPVGPVSASYHYGFSGAVGAGTYDRRSVEDSEPDLLILPDAGIIDATAMLAAGVVQVQDNKTYAVTADHLDIRSFTLQAANQKRPYLVLTGNWILDSGTNEDAQLVLDGLWIGSPGNSAFNIIVRGDFECVILRNCTLDPGGDTNAAGETLHPVSLVVEATVETLCIERCITGPIQLSGNGLIDDKLQIEDSIIQSVEGAVPAIEVPSGRAGIQGATVFGAVAVHSLYASEVIVTGTVTVQDTQSGCFRFSAAPQASRLPRPYESFLFPVEGKHWFGSRRFGQPPYGQLSDTAPAEIYRGAENGAEMGAFHFLLNAIKQDGLQTKVEEFMPFGLIPAFIHET